MYYIHTDLPIAIGIGSYETVSNASGDVVDKMSFDPPGAGHATPSIGRMKNSHWSICSTAVIPAKIEF